MQSDIRTHSQQVIGCRRLSHSCVSSTRFPVCSTDFIYAPTGASNTGQESTKPQGGDIAEIFLDARKKLQLDYWSHFIK